MRLYANIGHARGDRSAEIMHGPILHTARHIEREFFSRPGSKAIGAVSEYKIVAAYYTERWSCTLLAISMCRRPASRATAASSSLVVGGVFGKIHQIVVRIGNAIGRADIVARWTISW
jgi:hypothetical protein